jgi:hypothetical protein
MNFIDWLNNVLHDGLATTTKRYYSCYRALVDDNKDPDGNGRIKIVCPTVGHQAAPNRWVSPALNGAGSKRGTFFPPEVGDTVWVMFYEGDRNEPEVYWGGWFGKVDGTSDVPDLLKPPSSNLPEKKGFVTRAGHALVMNDEADKESVMILWNSPDPSDPAVTDRTKTAKYNKDKSSILSFDKTGFLLKTFSSFLFQIDETNGAITLTSPDGSMFNIAKSGATSMIHKNGAYITIGDQSIDITGKVSTQMNVNVSGQNVNLNGGGVNLGSNALDFAVLGLKLVIWLAKHTHGYAFGVTTPPVIPPTPADFVSNSVKVQE